ncbi:MAG: hypothetical protein K2O41_00215 [Clostridia bacterium]|nr:hypothetical protein [Clostridia bacterium]
MEKKTVNQQIVADDILRYKRNKLAQLLAILGLVFNCLYFCILYAIPDVNMRKITLGISVLLTLVLMLLIFLSSEGVKGYNKKFSIVLLVVAAFQILRIFYYPLKGLKAKTLTGIGYFGYYPTNSGFFFAMMLIWLVASAACLIAAAVLGWIYAVRLEKFQKKLDNGEISVEATLAQMDEEDAQAAVTAYAEPAETAEQSTGEVQ